MEALRAICEDAVGERRDPLWIVKRDLILAAARALEALPAEDRAVTAPQEQRTIHGGNVGATKDSLGVPFYLQPGQCEPEYDQGHSVVVWYDDLYDLGERTKRLAALTHAIEALREEMEQAREVWARQAFVGPQQILALTQWAAILKEWEGR